MPRSFTNVRLTVLSSAVAASWLGLASPAAAHIALLDPPARYDRSYQKDGPCGRADNPPGEVRTTYEAGQTITIAFDEFINHPGHYRVSLSAEGDGAFVDPTDYEDFYPAENVLLDDIEDPSVQTHAVEVKLPDGLICDHCVLQVLQIMYDKMPWGPAGGNEIYYQCSDIAIVPIDSGETTDTSPSESSTGDGDDTGNSESTTASAEESSSEASSDTTIIPGAETQDDDSGCACTAAPSHGLANGLLGMLVVLPFVGRRNRPRPRG